MLMENSGYFEGVAKKHYAEQTNLLPTENHSNINLGFCNSLNFLATCEQYEQIANVATHVPFLNVQQYCNQVPPKEV